LEELLNEKKIKEIELKIGEIKGERGNTPFISSSLAHTIY
jgi:hypothetical protein